MMEEAGLLASATAAATALLTWVGMKINASVKKTTDEAAGVLDWPKLRADVDALIKFREELEAERERKAERERRALEEKVEELERELGQRTEDSATSKSGVRTQPMRRGQ